MVLDPFKVSPQWVWWPWSSPSGKPSFRPSSRPTVSPYPSSIPSSSPSIHPTSSPSSFPSGSPTNVPTAASIKIDSGDFQFILFLALVVALTILWCRRYWKNNDELPIVGTRTTFNELPSLPVYGTFPNLPNHQSVARQRVEQLPLQRLVPITYELPTPSQYPSSYRRTALTNDEISPIHRTSQSTLTKVDIIIQSLDDNNKLLALGVIYREQVNLETAPDWLHEFAHPIRDNMSYRSPTNRGRLEDLIRNHQSIVEQLEYGQFQDNYRFIALATLCRDFCKVNQIRRPLQLNNFAHPKIDFQNITPRDKTALIGFISGIASMKNMEVSGCILQTRASLKDQDGCILAENNIFEDDSKIIASNIGQSNVIGCRCTIEKCELGNNNRIDAFCTLRRVKVGNNCYFSGKLLLEDMEIADNSRVFYNSLGKLQIIQHDGSGINSSNREDFEVYFKHLQSLQK